MPCIVMDLDETHVLVNTTLVDQLRIMLDAEVCGKQKQLTPISSKRTHIP